MASPSKATACGDRSDEDDYIPRGVLKTQRRGWQGEEMELEHLRSDKDFPKSTFCAVDKQQFYNHQIGEGYQAKHVFRQPKKEDVKQETQVISGLKAQEAKSSIHSETTFDEHRQQHKQEKRKRESEDDTKQNKLQMYLNSTGMRHFRREIEKILSTS